MKRSPMPRRTTPMKRTAFVSVRKALPKVGRKGRADQASLKRSVPIVVKRSGGLCEICLRPAVHIHHRQTGHANHAPGALLHLCSDCHQRVHSAPFASYRNGWLVRHPTDPATVPVRRVG